MKTFPISVRPRFLSGSGIAKKIRRAGLIPANMYGHGLDANLQVALDPRPLAKALSSEYGRNQLMEVSLEDRKFLAICREVEVHPVTRKLRHVDFFCVSETTPLQMTVPIRFLGRSAGQKAGGTLEIAARYVKVNTTPTNLPPSIDVNLEPFLNGQQLSVENLPFPDGVIPAFKRAFKVFELIAPKIVKVEAVDPKAKKKK